MRVRVDGDRIVDADAPDSNAQSSD